MKKLTLLLLPLIMTSVTGCQKAHNYSNGYGVFLGANDEDVNKILKYKTVCIDLDEFSEESIKKLKDKNIEIYAYLSVGSLEEYRSYYEEFKDLTFTDYRHWKDEGWVDVSNSRWQSHIDSEADRLYEMGADGIFMDNFDVYYVAKEEYECTDEFKEGILSGCKTMLGNLASKDLKLMINSGTEFLSVLDEEGNELINSIDVYAQESVFSRIVDYGADGFDRQSKSETEYFFEMIDMMKDKSEILLIEYTNDSSVVKDVKDYCSKNNFYYYITNSIKLEA